MTSNRRICVVITARASYSRIRSVLAAVREHPALELQIVVAASALLERYGNGVLAAPKAEGFGLAAYVIPIGLFLTGGGLVVFVLRRFTSDQPAAQVPVAAAAAERLSDAELERIVDDELASGGSGSERA